MSVGLLLFMLSAGLTLIFSMMSVLNFALVVSPLLVGVLGGLFERFLLRRIETHGARSRSFC